MLSTIKYYNKSRSKVRLKGVFSALFFTTRGVKQDGSMSPKLFAIYNQSIIRLILATGHGVFLSQNLKLDIILYADDILLLCNTLIGMHILLRLVDKIW